MSIKHRVWNASVQTEPIEIAEKLDQANAEGWHLVHVTSLGIDGIQYLWTRSDIKPWWIYP